MNKTQTREFEDFVKESGSGLLWYAALLTPDRAEAEDICQDTLQRLAARWGKVTHPGAFSRRVMLNLVIDRRRSKARRPREEPLTLVEDRRDPHAEDAHSAVETRPALLRALDDLTEQQRAALVLRYFDDRSERDIADSLGISVSATKSLLFRAVAKLKDDPALATLFVPTH